MTGEVNGKTGILTLVDVKPLEFFFTEIEHFDYVARLKKHAQFCGNWPRGVRSEIAERLVTVYLTSRLFSCRRLPQKRLDVPYRSVHQTTR